jgi:hypothetical protein
MSGGELSCAVVARGLIVGRVKSLAVELGPHGVRANESLPGGVKGSDG